MHDDIYTVPEGKSWRDKPRIPSKGAQAAPLEQGWTVAWHGRYWPDFTEDMRQQFESHIAGLGSRTVGYLKYCKQHLSMPENVFRSYMQAYATEKDIQDANS